MAEEMVLTEEKIRQFLQSRQEAGVSASALAKYRNPLYRLYAWLGEDKVLTVERCGQWRESLEAAGYRKITVQRYVTVVNDFLRTSGWGALCLPRPGRNDLTGRTFGYLTALEPTNERKRKYVVWRCRCRCGRETLTPTNLLLSGHTTSCGCLHVEVLSQANRYVEGTSLRQCLEDRRENPQSASGYVGVWRRGERWIAGIHYKGRRYHLGIYSNLEDAVKARARGKEWVMEEAEKLSDTYAGSFGERPARPGNTGQKAGGQAGVALAERPKTRTKKV